MMNVQRIFKRDQIAINSRSEMLDDLAEAHLANALFPSWSTRSSESGSTDALPMTFAPYIRADFETKVEITLSTSSTEINPSQSTGTRSPWSALVE